MFYHNVTQTTYVDNLLRLNLFNDNRDECTSKGPGGTEELHPSPKSWANVVAYCVLWRIPYPRQHSLNKDSDTVEGIIQVSLAVRKQMNQTLDD